MIRNQSYQQQQDRLKAQIHSFEVTVLDFIKMTFALWTFVGMLLTGWVQKWFIRPIGTCKS